MENKIQVNEQELMIKEYEGQRVVTMWDIARLHEATQDSIRKIFKRNIQHLIEGEDYFLVGKEEDFVSTLSRNGDIKQQTINRVKDIPVFTEAGYLLMTKPMTDEISWKVQRQLVNCYFKVKEQVNSGMSDSEKLEAEAPKYILEDINKTLEILTRTYKDMKVGAKDTFNMTRSLLQNVGIELPDIKSEKTNVNDFISLEEVASRVGILTPKGLPNKQAIVLIFKEISLNKSLVNITTYIDNENNEIYSLKYSPEVVGIVSEYLKNSGFPQYLEKISNTGMVGRCKVIYKE